MADVIARANRLAAAAKAKAAQDRAEKAKTWKAIQDDNQVFLADMKTHIRLVGARIIAYRSDAAYFVKPEAREVLRLIELNDKRKAENMNVEYIR